MTDLVPLFVAMSRWSGTKSWICGRGRRPDSDIRVDFSAGDAKFSWLRARMHDQDASLPTAVHLKINIARGTRRSPKYHEKYGTLSSFVERLKCLVVSNWQVTEFGVEARRPKTRRICIERPTKPFIHSLTRSFNDCIPTTDAVMRARS